MNMVFGVGMAKTGTHALAALFRDSLRCAHEPGAEALMNLVLHHHAGRIRRTEFLQFVRQLVDRMDLELNVSQINGCLIEALVESYPHAKFILTVRDCESWMRSFINHQLSRRLPPGSAWPAFRDFRFRPAEHPPRAEDAPLTANGLYGLEAYAAYWVRHNRSVLAAIPAGRLLIVPMVKLQEDAAAIGAFVGAGATRLSSEFSFQGIYVESPFDRLERGYVEEQIASSTGEVLSLCMDIRRTARHEVAS